MMFKVLIADDERHARERLKGLLAEFEDFSIDYEAASGDEVVAMLITKEIDIAFLDINMPGVPVFETLLSLKKPPLIVFQTAYSEYAVDAFGVDAVDYLLKPLSSAKLRRTVEKLRNTLQSARTTEEQQAPVAAVVERVPPRGERLSGGEDEEEVEEQGQTLINISVKMGRNIKLIPISDIYKISFEDGVTFVYVEEERYMANRYLNYYEERLDGKVFFRASRGELLNLNYIRIIHPMFNNSFLIELKNGIKVKLSRRRAKELRKIVDF